MPNEAGAPLLVDDDFTSEDNDVWTEAQGTFSVSVGNELQIDTVDGTSGYALDVVGDAHLGNVFTQVSATFNAGSDRVGFVFAYEGPGDFWAAVIENNTDVKIYEVSSGTWTARASGSCDDAGAGEPYTFTLRITQGHVDFDVGELAASLSYDNASMVFPPGPIGVIANATGTKFDNFKLYETPPVDGVTRQVLSSSATANGTNLTLDNVDYGGLAIVEGLWDDDVILQASVPVSGGLVFRYQGPNDYYNVRIETSGRNKIVRLYRMASGKEDTLYTSATFSGVGPWMLRVKIAGQTVDAWTDGTPRITAQTIGIPTIADGGFGLVATAASLAFKDLRIGYDNNADDDIGDPGDDVIYDEDFTGTSVSPTYDDNGNLTEDAWHQYKYDAWNRLVEVKTRQDALVIAMYAYDATGRRIKKAVSYSGDFDGTQYFYYAGQQMIEMRNGSEQTVAQVVFGTQYVDEPICMDVNGDPESGNTCDPDSDGDIDSRYFYHQDANYNVIALTGYDANPDYANGDPAERYRYDPYGRIHPYGSQQGAGYGGDRLRPATLNGQLNNPFTYTGRFLDNETGLYYNRARHYHPGLGRFVQRDSLGMTLTPAPPRATIAQIPRLSAAAEAAAGKYARRPQVASVLSLQYADGMNLYGYVWHEPVWVCSWESDSDRGPKRKFPMVANHSRHRH